MEKVFVSVLFRLIGFFLGLLTYYLYKRIKKWRANRKEIHERIDKNGNIIYRKIEKTIDYDKEMKH